MKVAILSDIHDHIWNLEKVLKDLKKINVEAIVFCGDFSAPFSAYKLASVGLPVYAALGNVDEDQIGIYEVGGKNLKVSALWKEFSEIELGKRKLAYCHYPKLAKLLAETEDYDAVFYGHTHKVQNEQVKNTLLLNPGSVCGINAGHVLGIKGQKPGTASYAIYNTKTNSAEIVEIK